MYTFASTDLLARRVCASFFAVFFFLFVHSSSAAYCMQSNLFACATRMCAMHGGAYVCREPFVTVHNRNTHRHFVHFIFHLLNVSDCLVFVLAFYFFIRIRDSFSCFCCSVRRTPHDSPSGALSLALRFVGVLHRTRSVNSLTHFYSIRTFLCVSLLCVPSTCGRAARVHFLATTRSIV